MPRLSLLFLLALAAAPAFAQTRPVEEPEEPGARTQTDEDRRYDELVARFQQDYFRVTTLVQIVPHVPFEDSEGDEAGFDVAAAWLGIGGRLGQNVGYFVRAAFEREPSLLEAYVSYGSDDVRGIVGRQKVPFSAEFLTAAADIDFVNRARIVRDVVPGRSTGVAINANPGGGPLRLRAGVFNASYTGFYLSTTPGEEIGGQSDRGGLLLAGRAQATVPIRAAGGEAVIGINAGYDTPDTSDRFGVSSRLALGADARLRLGRLLIAGEYIRSAPGDLELRGSTFPLGIAATQGGYATLGFDVTGQDRVLARLDVYEGSQEVLLGYNRTLTRAASVQLNVVIPGDSRAEPAQALANFQLAF